MKYGIVIDDEVYNVTELPKKMFGIPEPQLNERGWYKVIKDETEEKPWHTTESQYSFDGENVIETKIYSFISLDDWKAKKYEILSKEIHTEVTNKYPYHKQLSALNGTYDDTTNLEITTYCDTEVKRALTIKQAIKDAEDFEAVDAIYYVKREYDLETQELISEVYWGE